MLSSGKGQMTGKLSVLDDQKFYECYIYVNSIMDSGLDDVDLFVLLSNIFFSKLIWLEQCMYSHCERSNLYTLVQNYGPGLTIQINPKMLTATCQGQSSALFIGGGMVVAEKGLLR